jgi:hypothetical protein
MKNPLKFRRDCAWQPTLHRSRHLLGSLLISTLAANAEASLTFDNDLQGITAGGDATSLVWDSVGQRLEINTTGGWKPQCAYLDLNSNADPGIVALRAELGLALINGGTLSYDIIVETTSVTSADPANPVNPGWFETMYIGSSSAGWDQTYGGGRGQIAAYGAFPLAAPILHTVNYTIEAASSVASDTIAQFGAASGWYQIYFGLNSQAGTNVRYYIDNIRIIANEVQGPVVIPSLTITPTVLGLNMITGSTGVYDRQAVRTGEGLDVSWVGGSFPVSYELTVAECPTSSFETFINFVPGGTSPNSFAHYSEPTCVGVWIYSNADGGGTAYLRYKDGYPGSNGPTGREYWVDETAPSDGGGGQIVSKSSTKMRGTWSITFTSDTDFTITVPDGTSVSGALNPSTAAKFANPIFVYFGNTPTSAANIGLTAVLSSIKITGAGYPIDEELAANPMSSDLVRAASLPASVVQVTPDDPAKYWINWTMPATDYQLEQSTDLGIDGSWSALPSPVTYATKFGRSRLLKESEVLSPTTNFFRLIKPAAVTPDP